MTEFTAHETPPQDTVAANTTCDTPLATSLYLLRGEAHECPDAALARLPADHLQRVATAGQCKARTALT